MTTQALQGHTPGPWYATKAHVQSAALNEDNYVCLAEGDSHEQAEANARLIAAAPAMLEALREAGAWIKAQLDTANDVSEYDAETLELVRRAIAQATGQ